MKHLYFMFPTHHIQSTYPARLSSWLRRKTVVSVPYTQTFAHMKIHSGLKLTSWVLVILLKKQNKTKQNTMEQIFMGLPFWLRGDLYHGKVRKDGASPQNHRDTFPHNWVALTQDRHWSEGSCLLMSCPT